MRVIRFLGFGFWAVAVSGLGLRVWGLIRVWGFGFGAVGVWV